MKRAAPFNVPVLVGIIPLKSVGMARYMNKNVAGVFVPDHLIDELGKAEDKTMDKAEEIRKERHKDKVEEVSKKKLQKQKAADAEEAEA